MSDLELLLQMIDDCIKDLGTAGLVDGRSARDKLLDVRSLVMSMVRPIEDIVPIILMGSTEELDQIKHVSTPE